MLSEDAVDDAVPTLAYPLSNLFTIFLYSTGFSLKAPELN